MSQVKRVFSDAPWESIAGYCRAVCVGSQIFVTGTAPVAEDGSTFAPGDISAQTKRCLEIIDRALSQFEGEIVVVRTRMFVTDISQWEAVAKAHGERFRDAPPATTMVEVRALIDPDMLVEIEADAIML